LASTEPGHPARRAIARLHGRDTELERIGESLAEAARGQGSVLLVEGPPGIGNSRLLAEGCAMARRAGLRPLLGEAFESLQTVPFAPLLDAALGDDRPLADVDAVRGLAKELDQHFWLVYELLATLQTAAVEHPLAIVLDDLQRADAARSAR
jgi:predicted ATPase